MCGIAGFSGKFDKQLLAKMSTAIAHRGPDASAISYLQDEGIGLVHRRLAIIDLSAAGHQPMSDVDQRATIIYNGEIYNYRELRAELIDKGYSFNGHSDTEVLLNLYLAYGVEMLERLNGIFAFAIWDIKKQEMFVARDGLGVKPFYYSTTPLGFVFASEIKALLQENSVARDLNPVAIARHLTFLWSPSPDTILKSVRKLEPGFAMIVNEGQVSRKWQFYDLPFGRKKIEVPVDTAAKQLRQHIDQAVERQMVSDVPVGAFLSGGLDSSAVVASAQKISPSKMQCFTIDFNDPKAAAYEGMNEDLPYARRVAKHLDVDLHEITVGPEMLDQLEDMIYFLDEPQADPAPLNALFISKLARENGVKVLLSGAGGDDILTGYRRHYALSQEKYWAWLPTSIRSGIGNLARQLPTSNVISRRIRKGFEYAGLEQQQRLASYFFWSSPAKAVELLSPEFRSTMDGEEIISPLVMAQDNLPSGSSALDRMLYLECKYFLADHNLNYTDRMSMAHGVEVRVPLLDQDLVAYAAGLPDHLKQNGKTGKFIFKKAMEGVLPNDVIYRPKTGFGAPLRYWLRGPLLPMVNDLLNRHSIEHRGIFDANTVAKLIDDDMSGRVDATYTIFALMCIELWCRRFLDRTPV